MLTIGERGSHAERGNQSKSERGNQSRAELRNKSNWE